ncbi:MAG: ATP-binding protein [Planctomycetota bacterium]
MNDALEVLIIEDDRDTLANLIDILELDGHTISGVSTLAAAKALAGQHDFGVAIVDRKLPDGMIEDFLPELKEVLGQAEVIVITGFADMQSTITALRLGVLDYVVKPIIPDHLRRTVIRIAENHRLGKALAEEHAFADLVLNTAEAIVLVLDLSGNVIQSNPYFEQLTGWSEDRLKGCDWFEMCINEADRNRVRDVFLSPVGQQGVRGFVDYVRGVDGTRYQVRWSNTALSNHRGEASAVLAVGVDVSDVTEAQNRALQAERLAAIGETMTGLAHESRNALQRIQAATEMLLLEVEDNEHALKDVRAIQRANSDLKCLLDEVRSFAAPIHLRYESASLNSIWRRVWSDLTLKRTGRVIELREDVDSELIAEVDVLRMEQVFRNLFENAISASEDPVKILIGGETDGNQASVSLEDNGPGLTTEQQRKLFEPFYTTKQTGTGLGLAICQRIVEAHHGKIEAQSLDEGGARFQIALPLKKQSAFRMLT